MLSREFPFTRDTVLAGGKSTLGEAGDFVREFADDAGLVSDAAARLAIVVEELVANLLDHAGQSAGQPIALELRRTATAVVLVLTDTATPFDPRQAPPPTDLPPVRGGGAGLALVGAWARIDSYERRDVTNRLTLTIAD